MKFVQSGNMNGPTVVLIHGWPDTPLLWVHQLKALEPTYRCVCLMLPGFDFDQKFPFFGKKFTDLIPDAASTIKNEVMKGRPAGEKVYLVAHDWGASIAYALLADYPDLFTRAVTIDIGGHMKPGLGDVLFFVAYQWTLIFLYFIPRFIGNPLQKVLVKAIFKAPDTHTMTTQMNWIYFAFWRAIFTGSLPKSAKKFKMPNCPLLFMYGTKGKPCKFHSQKFLDSLKNGSGVNAGSGFVEYAGDHWFFTRSKFRDHVNTEIVKFLGGEAAPNSESVTPELGKSKM